MGGGNMGDVRKRINGDGGNKDERYGVKKKEGRGRIK